MSAPNLQYPPAAGGGTPVGGSGTVNTLPIWVAGSTLGDSAISQTYGCINTITLTSAGSGGAGGTQVYRAVPLINVTGTGSGAKVDVFINSSSVLTGVYLREPGIGYSVNDTATVSIGSLVGVIVTVASIVPSDNASGNITAKRISAGLSSPLQGISSSLGIVSTGFSTVSNISANTGLAFLTNAMIVCNPDADVIADQTNTTSPSGGSFQLGVDFSQRSASSLAYGVQSLVTARRGTTSGTTSVTGGIFGAGVSGPSASGMSSSVQGVNGQCNVFSTVTNANTINSLYCYATNLGCLATAVQTISNAGYLVASAGNFNNAAHVVTNWYGCYIPQPTVNGGSSIVNRYHFVSTDTNGRSHLRSKVFFGSAVGTAQVTAASIEIAATNTILSGTITNAGSGYTNGSYTVTLTGGSPSVAGSISVVVSGGVVTSVTVANGGEGYAVGNVLSATIAGGAGFQWTVTAVQGNGDVRLNSASAVFDASNSSTNGTKYFNRAGTGISSTTQSYYEEGSYTPTTTGGWTGTLAGTWTRIGRKVFITINVTGSPNGSTGASTLTLPSGLAPARGGAGIRVKTASGTALGNGVVSVDNVSGLIQISTAVTSDNDAKTIQCEYEV